MSAWWWRHDDLGLIFSHRTWTPCNHRVDHALLYIPTYSRTKCEAVCVTANAQPKVSHTTRTAANLQLTTCVYSVFHMTVRDFLYQIYQRTGFLFQYLPPSQITLCKLFLQSVATRLSYSVELKKTKTFESRVTVGCLYVEYYSRCCLSVCLTSLKWAFPVSKNCRQSHHHLAHYYRMTQKYF